MSFDESLEWYSSRLVVTPECMPLLREAYDEWGDLRLSFIAAWVKECKEADRAGRKRPSKRFYPYLWRAKRQRHLAKFK